jgi:hypothetical protein
MDGAKRSCEKMEMDCKIKISSFSHTMGQALHDALTKELA